MIVVPSLLTMMVSSVCRVKRLADACQVMQLLRRTAKISDKHNGKLCSALLHQLSTLGYRPSFVVLISTYLLPALHPRLPSILLERLSSVVPNLSAYHLMTLADALKETESLSPFSASDEVCMPFADVSNHTPVVGQGMNLWQF